MARKKNKKIKKFAKMLGAGLALAGLGRAFTNRTPGSTRAMTSDMAYTKGNPFGGVYSDPIMTGGVGVKGREIPGIRVDGNTPSLLPLSSLSFKKGGRVGCGIAKRGFGKAMKKGGKK